MGKMMGRSLHSPMAVNTSGVNKGPAPERPISMLGFTCMHRQIVAVVDVLKCGWPLRCSRQRLPEALCWKV